MSSGFPLSIISHEIKRLASEAGFDLAGVAGVADTPEHRFFPQWIADGRAGEMQYLETRNKAGELKRASLSSRLCPVPFSRQSAARPCGRSERRLR